MKLIHLACLPLFAHLLFIGCESEPDKITEPEAPVGDGDGDGDGDDGQGGQGGHGGASLGTGGQGGGSTSPEGGQGGAAPLECDSDLDCKSAGLLCNKKTNVCAECVTNRDCGESSVECRLDVCVAIERCKNTLECSGQLVCDTVQERCFQCVDHKDCDTGKCEDNNCVAP